jgi:hypothetical protein
MHAITYCTMFWSLWFRAWGIQIPKSSSQEEK